MESPKFGSHKSAEQWQSQLQQRGWTPEHINEAIVTGRRYSAPNYVNQGIRLPDMSAHALVSRW